MARRCEICGIVPRRDDGRGQRRGPSTGGTSRTRTCGGVGPGHTGNGAGGLEGSVPAPTESFAGPELFH